MEMMKTYLIVVALCLCSLFAMAQDDAVWTLSGRVTDAKTRKPMSYVSVTDRQVGTVTNEAGEFVLKLQHAPQTVTFSCLGYKTQQLSASALGGVRVEVRMEPSSVMLDEIVVKGADAKELVKKAMEKIDKNYPSVPNLLRGFYRETVDKRNRFTCISEGVVDVYKTAYDRGDDWREGVAILKGRRLLSQRPSDTLSVKLQGGPVLPIMLDVVKQKDILLNEQELNNYTFRYVTMSKADDRNQYVVEITPLYVLPYALYRGRLYIDQETLAFTRIDLSLDMSDPGKVTQMILKKKPLGLRFTPHELSIYIDYKTDNGVTRINYIRNVIRFRCDWKRKLFKSNFTVTSEMVVTDRQEGKDLKLIKSRDTFNCKDNFYDKVVYFNDPGFWGNDNIIEPTEDLLKGIEKIKKRISRD